MLEQNIKQELARLGVGDDQVTVEVAPLEGGDTRLVTFTFSDGFSVSLDDVEATETLRDLADGSGVAALAGMLQVTP